MDDYDRLSAFPSTVAAAVEWLDFMLTEEMKRQIRETAEADLPLLHSGLGSHIRNCLGLWIVNQALFDDAGAADADGASSIVLEALWRKLGGGC